MTREEAIEILQEEWDFCLEPAYVKNAIQLAITVLHGPTRETLEKTFPGCPLCKCGGLDYAGFDSDGLYFAKPPAHEKFRFCPACGKPITDEAVDMMLER